MALARSGDKGPNLNFGIYARRAEGWAWLQAFLSRRKVRELAGEDWREEYFVERVEFEGIWAVHFVIYGILGRGVSSSARLDAFGKGFADYIRDKWVEVPVSLLEGVKGRGEGVSM